MRVYAKLRLSPLRKTPNGLKFVWERSFWAYTPHVKTWG